MAMSRAERATSAVPAWSFPCPSRSGPSSPRTVQQGWSILSTGNGKSRIGTGPRSVLGSGSLGGGFCMQSPFSHGARGNPPPGHRSRRSGESQMTSVSISPSTFFFCFSITASSSDTFSLSSSSTRCTVTWLYTRAPSSGLTARNSSFCSEKICAPVSTPSASTVLSKGSEARSACRPIRTPASQAPPITSCRASRLSNQEHSSWCS
ncbi:PREDICTED: uncharacterized protein LOC106725610 [Myotis brandtii]|uniref:uncharacterized protein LOC106725610 n=1 Tax=Myotis brandtii TaxID=109478 RepID=UPI000704085D|nr:PREDICTED: uncharacterized protein LOC106725610 [Myotis brandtii]